MSRRSQRRATLDAMREPSVRIRTIGVPLTFVRPYDEATRERVFGGLQRAGAELAKVFREPVDLTEVRGYLDGAGKRDRLCIPYFVRAGATGLELIGALHDHGGARRIVMPVKIASPTLVRQQVERAIGAEAMKRVLVLSIDEIADPSNRDGIAAHLHGDQL
jgi:hypothetical protein